MDVLRLQRFIRLPRVTDQYPWRGHLSLALFACATARRVPMRWLQEFKSLTNLVKGGADMLEGPSRNSGIRQPHKGATDASVEQPARHVEETHDVPVAAVMGLAARAGAVSTVALRFDRWVGIW